MKNRCKKYMLLTLFFACLRVQADDVYMVDFHTVYGNAQTVLAEGRVLEKDSYRHASARDGHWRNLKRNLQRFDNDEAKNMSLHIWLEPVPDEKEFVRQWQAQTDKEGYFRQEMPASKPYATGWRNIYANVRDKESQGRALIVPEGNRIGIISDIDDTVMISEVHSKRRLLSNTFLKNTLQRQTFPGTAGLYAMLAQKNPEPAATPIFYLSASPRQLHGAITKFLEHNQFPAGILVAKRISYDLAGEPIFDQHAYKTEKIKEIFGRLPNVCFILAGDDGEKDPEIYNHIRQTYSDRVLAVWIRRVNPDPERPRYNGQQDFPSSLETTGLPQ